MKTQNLKIRIIFLFSVLFFIVSCTETPSEIIDDPLGDNLALGNPSNAVPNIIEANNYLMEKPQYSLSYNNTNHTANWVSWHLNKFWMGNAARQNDFRPDPALYSSWYHVTTSDYTGSGFDRGHLCPSADRTASEEDNSATFLMSNIIPQAPKNNQNTWENLESYCRTLVNEGYELYIISGTYGKGGIGSDGYAKTIPNGVVVPSQIWKIIVVLSEGNDDLKRITTSTRVIAVLTPNSQTSADYPWTYYRTTVDKLELLTGFDFLTSVPKPIQDVIESNLDNELIQ